MRMNVNGETSFTYKGGGVKLRPGGTGRAGGTIDDAIGGDAICG